ncbi:flagellar hook-length control protein FliK [Limnobacter sp.]|uniref:flagellar hook-length control protein FliK n=1 Tax=Limnobacter sp. TaxID=2003368 RepID=UPI002FDFAF72
MTTSTQAMSNVSKVQTTAGSSKTNSDPKELALQFEALFSSALGQLTPNAQLNNIEAQLRESLFKQDSKPGKKYAESSSNAEAAQATVWAQRNWMQDSSNLAAAPVAATDSDASTEKTAPPAQATSENRSASNTTTAEKTAERPVEKSTDKTPADAEKDNVDKSVDRSDNKADSPPGASNTDTKAVQQLAAQAQATTDNTVATGTPVSPATSTAELPAKPAAELTNHGKGISESNSATDKTENLPATAAQANDKATETNRVRLDDRSTTGNAKVDAALNNSTVNVRAENATVNTPANTFTNANAVAAQLAPQIARQAQNIGENIELQGLKAGQKIMAGASLQATATPTALAAGTNGLNGTLGTAQQALIKTPVTQPGFAREMGQTVQWAIGKNLSTVDIRVNPESFGPMNMRLVQKGQQVQLIIRTQDETSANLLTQALSGLKEVLSQNGIQLSQVQIQHNNTPTPNGQANNGQSQFDHNGNQGRNGQQSAPGGNTQPEESPLPSTAPTAKAKGKLDLFA